jgi:hypothetical protein
MWHTVGRDKKVYKVLLGKLEGNRNRKWEDGIRMDLKEIGWGCGLHSTG